MPGATALRCFVAAFEEHSADEKHVGWGVANQRIMARPDRVPFVSLPHFPKSPSPLISSSQPAGPLFLGHPLNGAGEACLARTDAAEAEDVALQTLETVDEK